MANRQEQKAARKAERLERERKEQAAAARRKRLQLVAFVAAAILIVGGGAAFAFGALGGGGGGDEGEPEQVADAAELPTLPTQATADLGAAAKAAGCTVSNPKLEGAEHEEKAFAPADYQTNPPTSGNHAPDWYEDGIYVPGTTPELGKLVHPLEHGRILVQYKPGTPESTVRQLEALLAEQSDGYHMLLYENTTGMKPAVAATAWTHSLSCPEMNPEVFDAMRTFRERYIDKGPEKVP